MKFKTLLTVLGLWVAAAAFGAKPAAVEPAYAWTLQTPEGIPVAAPVDTLQYNYFQQSVAAEVSDVWAATGNLGGPGKDMVWLTAPKRSDFFFRDAFRPWMPQAGSRQKWYNSRIPMTLLSYNLGGSKETEQNRLKAIFSGNATKRIQIGAMVDYLYSKGSYNYQATKDLSWGFSGSYRGERWQLMASYAHWNLLTKENGGITNDLYITDPAEMQGGDDRIESKSIPTRLTGAHTRLKGGELLINNRVNFGYWKLDSVIGDTLEVKHYVPVTAVFWNLSYRNDSHQFINDNAREAEEFWGRSYLTDGFTRDHTTFWSLSNSIGLSLIEGFNKWVPVGAAAWVRHEMRRYTQCPDTISALPVLPEGLSPLPEGCENIQHKRTQQRFWVGAAVTRHAGKFLKIDASAEVGINDATLGNYKLDGRVTAEIPIRKNTLDVSGYVKLDNSNALYLTQKYISNHFAWNNSFGKVNTVRFGGTLRYKPTGSLLDVGVENVKNYVYFGPDALPMQEKGNVQVFWAQLRQDLSLGILHWNNRITYQTSSNDRVIPLPKLAVYSNLYLWFKVAKVLTVQLGVDCDYYTRYYAPGYQPATASFYNQHSRMVGNYPNMTAYLNCKLSKARFYVMMTHVNQGWLGGNEYFAAPGYPINPRRFLMGVAVDLAN